MERKIIIYRNNATHTEEMTGDVSNMGQLKQLFMDEGIDYAKYDIYKIWGGKSECITNEINSYAFPDTVKIGRSNKETSDLYFSLVKKDKNIDTARSTSMVKLNRNEAFSIIHNRGLEQEFKTVFGKPVTNASNDELYMFLYRNDIDINVVELKRNGIASLQEKANSDVAAEVEEKAAMQDKVEQMKKQASDCDNGCECEKSNCTKRFSGTQTTVAEISPAAAVIALYGFLDDEERKKVDDYFIVKIGMGKLIQEAKAEDKHSDKHDSGQEEVSEEDIDGYLMEMTRNIVK